jgi:SSS family solute:Na+ symporter/sodium/pantothenate symporter
MSSSGPGYGAIGALFVIIAASVWLGTLAQRAIRQSSFLKGYFLGNRGLGVWALALTATVQSGGTFMGFPALVYSYGWIVALWIASYMVVPITGFAILGKRFAQISRRTGAITVPDFFRERFDSPAVGLVASIFILIFLTVYTVAQFKAGGIIMQVAWPGTGVLALSEDKVMGIDRPYLVGLGLFTLTVVAYTLIGGFLAAVWTDLFQSVFMLVGVVILLALTLPAAGGLEQATRTAVENTGPGFASGPGYSEKGREFLPLGLAVSYWFVWVFAGLGQPASQVRVMACKDTPTIRRSIAVLSVYNALIYIPLILICVCGRTLFPSLKNPDEFVPLLTLNVTRDIPAGGLLAGLILAAPFGAVMSTVATYLVVIASGVTRDVYQRLINPKADDRTLKRLSRVSIAVVGAVAILFTLHPPKYLQAIIVFGGTGAASAFLIPALMAAYWRRATARGCLAAMLGGMGVFMLLYGIGWVSDDPMIGPETKLRPYFLLGLEPFVWSLTASLLAGVGVSLVTRPPDPARVSRLFDRP